MVTNMIAMVCLCVCVLSCSGWLLGRYLKG